MVCPVCGGLIIQIDYVTDKVVGRAYRKRVCTSPGCGKVYFTEERIVDVDEEFMNIYMGLLAKREEKG